MKDAVALAGIHTQEYIDVVKGQSLWTYSTYFNLLKAAASEDDRAKKRTSTGKRTVKNLKQKPGKVLAISIKLSVCLRKYGNNCQMR